MAGRQPGVVVVSHASDLGSWTFHSWQPAALASVVESIWEVRGTVANRLSRIFPNGRVDLLVNLGPPQRIVSGLGMSWFDVSCVSGVQLGPLLVEAGETTHLFGVRLRAHAAGALLAAPMDGVAGRLELLPDVAGRPARALVEGILRARGFVSRALLVCRWIEEARASSLGAPAEHVAWVASAIESARGAVGIEPLRRRAGVSAKRLAADFRSSLGVTPKVFARLMRFQGAIGLLQGAPASLADVALAAGYYDQAHLGLEFRSLAGLTPREFVASVYPDGTTAVA